MASPMEKALTDHTRHRLLYWQFVALLEFTHVFSFDDYTPNDLLTYQFIDECNRDAEDMRFDEIDAAVERRIHQSWGIR